MLKSGNKFLRFLAFFKSALKIALRVVSHKSGIAVHARESIVATLCSEIPRYLNGDSTSAKPPVISFGEVVLTSRKLA